MEYAQKKALTASQSSTRSWTMDDFYTARFSGHAMLARAWAWAKTQEPMDIEVGRALFTEANATSLSLIEAMASCLDFTVMSERFDEWRRAAESARRDGGLPGNGLKSIDRIFDVFIAKMLGSGVDEPQGLIWRREGGPAMRSCFALTRVLSGEDVGDELGQKILDHGFSSSYARAIHAPSCAAVARVRAWLMMGADARSVGFGRDGFDTCLRRSSSWWLASNLAEFGAVPSSHCRELAGLRAVEAFRRGGWRIGLGRAQELVSAAGALFSAGGDEAKAFRSKKGFSIGGLIIQEVELHQLETVAKALGESGGEMIGRAAWPSEALRVAYEQGALDAAASGPVESKRPARRI